MHVVVGLIGLVATLLATLRLEQGHTHFTGLFYAPAALLLLSGPLWITLIAHPLGELLDTARLLAAALQGSVRGSRERLYEELSGFAQALRRGNPAEALSAAEQSSHALLRQLGPLAVKRYSVEELERTASAAAYVAASAVKRAEEVLTSLARGSPAIGLIGTTLGLVSLLKDLQNFEQLGPSMALALLCTFYGLLLANAVWQPLARRLHARGAAMQEEARLLVRALALLEAGRPLADVRSLFGADNGGAVPEPRLAAE